MVADVRIATCYVHVEHADVHLLRAIRAAGMDGNDYSVGRMRVR